MPSKNPLWDVIQEFMDDPKHRYAPKVADIARESGVSDQVLSKWKARPTLPTPEQLIRVAKGTGIPYGTLLVAALRGKGYVPPARLQEVVEATGAEVMEHDGWMDAWMRAHLELDVTQWLNYLRARQTAIILADLVAGGDGLGPMSPSREEYAEALELARTMRLRRLDAREESGALKPPPPGEDDPMDNPVDQWWITRSGEPFWTEGPRYSYPGALTKDDVTLASRKNPKRPRKGTPEQPPD
jgi:transcriptional regulator with XRE-family HTH domain